MSEQLPNTERPQMNSAQEATLRRLCTGYQVEFDNGHYFVYAEDSWMMPGYAEGWIGGEPGTLYVGVDKEGNANS